MAKLKVKQYYVGWASDEAHWAPGDVVEVDDKKMVSCHIKGEDTRASVKRYLLEVFPARFEEEKPAPSKAKETK